MREQEALEEEEEEIFYESNDHILSSSSDNDDSELDVWISEPSSIKERRLSLLQKFGLASDPCLARIKQEEDQVKRSISYDSNNNNCASSSSATIIVPRSKSDTCIDQTQKPVTTILPTSSSKPPRACRHKSSPGINFELENTGNENYEITRRTIKNLDTGKEFVVNKDFKNVREVGTRRHLSMEEFDMCVVGQSPIVQELMRRQNNKDVGGEEDSTSSSSSSANNRSIKKGAGGWFNIKNVINGGALIKSTSTHDDGGNDGPRRTKVRHYGKPRKELTGLFMSQEINAHNGSIWTIKFSLDGKYLASAGEDCVIYVWQVSENENGENSRNLNNINVVPSAANGALLDPVLALACIDDESHWDKKTRAKLVGRRRSTSSVEQLMVPEYVFALSDKSVCCFRGHVDDVLDLSWSKSQHLLSSSMDKTVKLWHLSSNSCLKVFSHSDYVTCIQFSPFDDNYFISGSLDEKVRLWSIRDRQVVDWDDLHEMVTAACYTPDGQSALVGSHKGTCYLYNTSENKLLERRQVNLLNKKKKSSHKKITGFQFSPVSSSDVIITSADSRIRVINGVDLIHKFKGFRNTSSQISAYSTANGKYLISASEDSHVYIWRYDATDSRPSRSKGCISSTECYEQFYCEDVTVALPWPVANLGGAMHGHDEFLYLSDNAGATWPEEKLFYKNSPQVYGGSCNGGVVVQSRPAWGMVIVTAGRGGQIKIFQNFGFPL